MTEAIEKACVEVKLITFTFIINALNCVHCEIKGSINLKINQGQLISSFCISEIPLCQILIIGSERLLTFC